MKKIAAAILIFVMTCFIFLGCSTKVDSPINSGISSPSIAASPLPVQSISPSPPPSPTQSISPSSPPSLAQSISPSLSPSPTKSDGDFRNAKWGMTKDEVIASEGNKPTAVGEDSLLYENKDVAGFPTSILYSFNNKGKLISGMYTVETIHTNQNDYIKDYSNLKDKLTSKYGKTWVNNDVRWKKDSKYKKAKEYGMAVAVGDLEYLSIWDTNNSRIGLSLYGVNFKISLLILYDSPEAINVTPKNTNGL